MNELAIISAPIADDLTVFQQAPHNIEAEQNLLGALLINNEHLNKIADVLLPEHFYMPLHSKIYDAITKFMSRGLVANPVTLKSYFANDETLKQSGTDSYEYLLNLCTNATIIINIESFSNAIYEAALRRSLISIGSEIVQTANNENINLSPELQIETAEQRLFNLAIEGKSDTGLAPINLSVSKALDNISQTRARGGKINGVTSGYTQLDEMLGGLQNSDLLILAARPSMGKTSLAINIGLNAAKVFADNPEKKGVGIFSLEMSSEQIAMRMLSIMSDINGVQLRNGMISKEQFSDLVRQSGNLSSLPIYLDDTPALSISALRTRARRMKRQHNISLLIVDYLQLLRGSSQYQGNTSRVNEVGEITQGLKAIAKELNLPVIALSQLSRAVETRENKRPQLSDLRESGNIEQDADVVMFIYREEYYLARKMPVSDEDQFLVWQEELENVKGVAEVIIGKQRNGPIGAVSLRFNSNTTGFSDM